MHFQSAMYLHGTNNIFLASLSLPKFSKSKAPYKNYQRKSFGFSDLKCPTRTTSQSVHKTPKEVLEATERTSFVYKV